MRSRRATVRRFRQPDRADHADASKMPPVTSALVVVLQVPPDPVLHRAVGGAGSQQEPAVPRERDLATRPVVDDADLVEGAEHLPPLDAEAAALRWIVRAQGRPPGPGSV